MANENPVLISFLANNGCPIELKYVRTADNYFTSQRGYIEGQRFDSSVFRNRHGETRAISTIMKDMPHGIIAEETRYTWEFFQSYSR